MTPTSFAVIPCRQYYPNPITISLYFFYSSLMNIPIAPNLFPLLLFRKVLHCTGWGHIDPMVLFGKQNCVRVLEIIF